MQEKKLAVINTYMGQKQKNFDFENLDFNISHEGNWVIFGAAKDIKIGIDAVCFDRPKNITSIVSFIQSFESQVNNERVNKAIKRSTQYLLLLLETQLTQNEMHMIMDNKDEETRLSTFFELWGCKESYIKAIGVGLSLELNKLDFYNDLEGHQVQLIYCPYFSSIRLFSSPSLILFP